MCGSERYFIRVFEIFRQAGIALGSNIKVVSKESFDCPSRIKVDDMSLSISNKIITNLL
jgi:Fe2+ transport system protein FeoA